MNKLDPKTIEGDYNEAYQRWTHHFDKASEKIEECFRYCMFVPFESSKGKTIELGERIN